MGHMLNNTIQDVLVRRARMQGKNACWVPGTDHASIATEAKVVRKLRDRGIKKSDLSRDAFLEHAWDWTREHGSIILKLAPQLGASCGWDRTNFRWTSTTPAASSTPSSTCTPKATSTAACAWSIGTPRPSQPSPTKSPPHRGAVQAPPRALPGRRHGRLAHHRHDPTGDHPRRHGHLHPSGGRTLHHLHGKRAIVPVAGRSIPIILDEYVDREFGTGCLKVTPPTIPTTTNSARSTTSRSSTCSTPTARSTRSAENSRTRPV